MESSYAYNRFFLTFHDAKREQMYSEYVMGKTIVVCRGTWIIFLFFLVAFSLVDEVVFGLNASEIMVVRVVVFILALLIFLFTWHPLFRRFYSLDASFLTLFNGFMSIYLLTKVEPEYLNVYFLSMPIAFTAVVATAGLGFRFSWFIQLLLVVVFEVVFNSNKLLPVTQFIVYSFFLVGIMIVFMFISYFIERLSRDSYIQAVSLEESQDRIETLRKLVPICANCKRIRDDSGYWHEVEVYMKEMTDTDFSHSLCPTCMEKLYGHEEWYIETYKGGQKK